jgi:hypothetical protein
MNRRKGKLPNATDVDKSRRVRRAVHITLTTIIVIITSQNTEDKVHGDGIHEARKREGHVQVA